MVLVTTAVLSFAAVWSWVLAMPLAFLEPEYASWRAKQIMVERCDLGDVLVLGDSRANVGFVPARLGVRTTNLAVGGGEAVEALAILSRALACPTQPKLVVLSLDAVHFARPDLFWERTMRFGFLDAADLAALRDASQALGDYSVYEERHTDGIPSLLRDRLYLAHFPPFYFGSLIEGRLLWRWQHNRTNLARALADRGQYYFGVEAGSTAIAADGKLEAFRPLPVLAHYFDRILALLEARGIPSVFVAMPINDTTARAIRPAVPEAFAVWLAGFAERYPSFQVVGPVVVPWEDRWFGDGFAHLNPAGAMRFSAAFDRCLTAGWTDCAPAIAAAGQPLRDMAAAGG